ncbi:ABC-F family ATP-binding cassette domain-containing protein [Corynebacterium lowii]|uniref:Putative ABC transporter ATP-binding protein YjjK n=1 Tax=Corynebacterium lowii TaxID=1544413 RepID=A0A0Q1E1T8_9CORY|nr:ATP-binding cassette domain-containing protein [Corynebacterium lowii]KQB86470.1 putative ABC transporter ATP-binding protein YjjK [Corynebacterium lowii]MDP9850954.1 ATPase subunit of ABC transporter with duplicated ATPase domains [Corynebacterium lowii]
MGYLDVQSLKYFLDDGRLLLRDISFRVGEGERVALIGANGSGKTTLLKIITGDIPVVEGAISRGGELAVMPQFMQGETVREALVATSTRVMREMAEALWRAEHDVREVDDEAAQMKYASLLLEWGDRGGYELEALWSFCTMDSLGLSYEECADFPTSMLSGGEQKRLMLNALMRGSAEILLLDEPDNFLDVPGKRWLEEMLLSCDKTVLYVSHDRELLFRTATKVVTVELGERGNTVWVHGGGFGSYYEARENRGARLDELNKRWEEEHQRLRELVREYKNKAAYNSDMASRYRAARTRLEKFESHGRPEKAPREQDFSMRLRGGRTGKRVLICEGLELRGLTHAYDFEARYGDRVAVLGPNGSGKSHFLRLLARGGSDPSAELVEVAKDIEPVSYSGVARLGARVWPGWFAQTQGRPDLHGRTLLSILHCGEGRRQGMPREEASRALDRYGLVRCAQQRFEDLSGGQRARFQILLLELSGATMLLLDEPTDNLDLESGEAVQKALRAFSGTVIAVTHDRWFARDFDRYLLFSEDGSVTESDYPLWE